MQWLVPQFRGQGTQKASPALSKLPTQTRLISHITHPPH